MWAAIIFRFHLLEYKKQINDEKITNAFFALLVSLLSFSFFLHLASFYILHRCFLFAGAEIHVRAVLPWRVTRAALWRGREEEGGRNKRRLAANRWESGVRGWPLGRRERAAELGMKIAGQTPTFVALVQYGIVHCNTRRHRSLVLLATAYKTQDVPKDCVYPQFPLDTNQIILIMMKGIS